MAFSGDGRLRRQVGAWRSGSSESQWAIVAVLMTGISLSLVVSVLSREWMPLSGYWVWLVVSMLLLRFGPLLVVAIYDVVVAIASLVLTDSVNGLRVLSLVEFAVAAGLLLTVAARQRTGLPTSLSGSILGDLKDRLDEQSRIPELPEDWAAQSAMVAGHGSHYAGKFLVSRLDEESRALEVILVDVCGTRAVTGPAAIQFAGVLGGLIGALPADRLLVAANDFLCRNGEEDDCFVTAVHVRLELDNGAYLITNAGHPPVLRWDLPMGEWVLDGVRGTALGVLREPDLHTTEGRLFPGEGLLFYTDGLIDGPSGTVDVGLSWLQSAARDAMGGGFGGAARRIVSQVDSGEDDRAVLILSRTRATVPAAAAVPEQAVRV